MTQTGPSTPSSGGEAGSGLPAEASGGSSGAGAPGPAKPVDLVLEGGGVKGIGLVGAISVLTEHGYEFQRVAGTSAGAMSARWWRLVSAPHSFTI